MNGQEGKCDDVRKLWKSQSAGGGLTGFRRAGRSWLWVSTLLVGARVLLEHHHENTKQVSAHISGLGIRDLLAVFLLVDLLEFIDGLVG